MKTIALISAIVLGTIAVASAKGPFVATPGPDGVQHVEIIGGSYFFRPDHIVVQKGVPVEIRVRKEPGITPHNFVLEGAKEDGKKINLSLKSSEQRVIKFTPHTAGTFKFYCDKRFLFFKSHRKKGMEGTLEVRD